MQLGLFSGETRSSEAFASAGNLGTTGSTSMKDVGAHFSKSARYPADADQADDAQEEGDELFYPSFTEIRRVLITCILSTDMELFRHHHEEMRKRAQMKRSGESGFSLDRFAEAMPQLHQ